MAGLCLWAISGVMIVASLVALPTRMSVREKLADPEFLLRGLIATALLSPHFYYYDLVWLLFPLQGIFISSPRRGLLYAGGLWMGMLIAQQMETGWPVLSLVLLTIFAHTYFVRWRGATPAARQTVFCG
jgi:hypothetical protein